MNSAQVKIAFAVSIPLFTGLDYNGDDRFTLLSLTSLNPFIYRAGLQPEQKSNTRCARNVSIPLFTGLDYN